MLESVFLQLHGFAKALRDDAERRHKITTTDPVADTLDYVAGDLDALVKRMKSDTEMLSPRQYASLHKTTPQTVIAWIHAGKLSASPRGRGWEIPRTAIPPRLRQRRRKVA